MMTRSIAALLCLGLLVGCGSDSGGNPLIADDTVGGDTPADTGDTGGDTTTDTGAPLNSTATLPPGTATPTPDDSIFRSEAVDQARGDGYANSYSYDPASDTFFVDGLAFDGTQPNGRPYSRSNPGSLAAPISGGRFALYEAPVVVTDPVSGNLITQFEHRALYGVSASGQSEFAIVRTAGYEDFAFGGFIYQRNGGVVLPDDGQATYTGDYGGIREVDRGGFVDLELVNGQAQVDIDFRGFRNNCAGTTCADAVRGYIFNRRVYAPDGTDLTVAKETELGVGTLPTLRFTIGPNVMTENGEITGQISSVYQDSNGDVQSLESGNYYALMSGDHTGGTGGEIVGVVVVESSIPNTSDTVRETGGFLVNR